MIVISCLAEFVDTQHSRFKFYVVFQGKISGIFHTWLEIQDSISDFPKPIFKGFNNLSEAHSAARSHIGLNYFVAPSLRNYAEAPPTHITHDTNQILFCDHCEILQKTVLHLNKEKDDLAGQNTYLINQLAEREKEIEILKQKLHMATVTPLEVSGKMSIPASPTKEGIS